MSSERRHREDDCDDQIEESLAKKPRKTASSGFLLLDRCGYEHHSDDDDGGSTWTTPSVTCRCVPFQLSLRREEPPAVSRLLFKADVPADILTSYDPNATAYFFIRPLSTQFTLTVVSSDDNAVLLTASCGGGTDFFVMDLLQHCSPPSSLIHLQEMPPPFTMSHSGMSLMRCGDSSYVVAGLNREGGTKGWHVVFLSTSSLANLWRRKVVRLPPEFRDWYSLELAAVLICGGRFWWLDLRCGLLLSCSCDSLLQEDEDDTSAQHQPLDIEFTLLPNVTIEQAKDQARRQSKYPLQRDRCVGVSGGRLRYVEVRAHRHRPSRSPGAPPPLCDDCRGGDVTTWVLDEGRGGWAEERTVKFTDVWRDESYRTSGLPKEAPEFPLVHPLDPNVVYFSIREGGDGNVREFCVHLGTKQVMSCSTSYEGFNGADLELLSCSVHREVEKHR